MYGYASMMTGTSILGVFTWIAVLAFFILGSIYFWQQINKKR